MQLKLRRQEEQEEIVITDWVGHWSNPNLLEKAREVPEVAIHTFQNNSHMVRVIASKGARDDIKVHHHWLYMASRQSQFV